MLRHRQDRPCLRMRHPAVRLRYRWQRLSSQSRMSWSDFRLGHHPLSADSVPNELRRHISIGWHVVRLSQINPPAYGGLLRRQTLPYALPP